MRPKYKCYDKKLKELSHQFIKHICAEDGTELQMIAFAFHDGPRSEIITLADALDLNDRYIVVMFTGKSDKNGVELYSGDRVKSFDKWVFQICFGKFQSHMSGELHVGFFLKTLDDRTYPLSEARDYEKIGNIHSDPLEEKDDH